MKAMRAECTVAEFQEHSDSYDGFCIACGEWSCGGVEPDACGYTCEFCGEDRVYGASEILFMNLLDITD